MTASSTLVSVIIPVYNGASFLAEAIESVLDQTYSPFELFVVDDGSTDASASVARSYEPVRYLHQANRGQGAALNHGLGLASGDFVDSNTGLRKRDQRGDYVRVVHAAIQRRRSASRDAAADLMRE